MEINNENEKNIEKIASSFKPERGLADESYRITIHDFGKRLLYPVRKIEEIVGLENADGAGKEGKKGEFIARTSKNQGELTISYWVDLNSEPIALDLTFTKNLFNFEPGVSQKIDLCVQELSMGTRWFFICQGCGKRRGVLYMAKGFHSFSCRDCQNLIYESSRLNRRAMRGLGYYIVRRQLLAEKRAKIDRVFYNGKKTKRFERFSRMFLRLEKMKEIKKLEGLLDSALIH